MVANLQEQMIEHLKPNFLDCRDFGHAWGRSSPLLLDRHDVTIVNRDLLCARCTSRRMDMLSRNSGEVLSRRYTYVDGYQLKGIGQNPPRHVIRLIAIQAALRATKKRRRK